MQFQEIHMHAMTVGVVGIMFSLFIAAVIFGIAVSPMRLHKGMTVLSIIVAVAGAGSSIYIGEKTIAENNEALLSNIQEKYDVDEVLLEYRGTETKSVYIKDQQVHVLVDGQVYAFDLEQDKETWEPTLLDPAINGGSDEEKNLSAEELLR